MLSAVEAATDEAAADGVPFEATKLFCASSMIDRLQRAERRNGQKWLGKERRERTKIMKG